MPNVFELKVPIEHERIKSKPKNRRRKPKVNLSIIHRNVLYFLALILAIIMSEEISVDDLERVINRQTRESVYRFKADVAERKGFTDLMEIDFDIISDKKTGHRWIEIESIPDNFNIQGKIRWNCLSISLRTRR